MTAVEVVSGHVEVTLDVLDGYVTWKPGFVGVEVSTPSRIGQRSPRKDRHPEAG